MGGLVWLASYPKSGNTWIRSFLNNLIHNTQEPADINSMRRFSLSDTSRSQFQEISSRPLEELDFTELLRLRFPVQARMTKASTGPVLVKTHNCLGDWRGIKLHDMKLTAAAVYILRNPLDVAVSVAPHFNLTTDKAIDFMSAKGAGTKLSGKYTPELYGTWSEHVLSWTVKESPGLLVLRYEDLLDKPAETFGELGRFLRVPADEERLMRAIRHSSFDVLKAQEEVRGFIERPEHAQSFFRVGKAGQWREVLTPDQVRQIISGHWEQMERFGYIPDDYRDAIPEEARVKIKAD